MELIPKPKNIDEKQGCFLVKSSLTIVYERQMGKEIYTYAKLLQKEVEKSTGICPKIKKSFFRGKHQEIYLEQRRDVQGEEGYYLEIEEDRILIRAERSRGLLYGIATLIQIFRAGGNRLPCVEIQDAPDFQNRGYMLDIARGRVPKLSYLKKLAKRLALYKVNQLHLYVESGVMVPELSEICAEMDVLTFQEIIEFDDYCQNLGIELVPCIATFGHLYDMLRTDTYKNMREMDENTGEPFTWYHRMRYHILDVTKKESFQVIWKILMQYLPLFRSKKVNICCDETFDLGKGKSKELVEEQGYARVYYSYVNHLAQKLQEMGYEVMMWADIALNHREEMKYLNKDVICLNWYYYYDEKEEDVRIFEENNRRQYVCPSVSGYSRLVNAYDLVYSNVGEMARYGKKYHAEGFLNTDWGDTGHINMPALAVPAMIYGAALSWNTEDSRTCEEFDEDVSRLEYGDLKNQTAALLRKLSRQDKIIFNDLTFIRDYEKYGLLYDDLGDSLYKEARKRMEEISEDILRQAVSNCEEILSQLLQDFRLSGVTLREQKEFCLSAQGVGLTQKTVLAWKEHLFHQKLKITTDPQAIAEEWENFIVVYAKLWRVTSKESELPRIREFCQDICRILRNSQRQEAVE